MRIVIYVAVGICRCLFLASVIQKTLTYGSYVTRVTDSGQWPMYFVDLTLPLGVGGWAHWDMGFPKRRVSRNVQTNSRRVEMLWGPNMPSPHINGTQGILAFGTLYCNTSFSTTICIWTAAMGDLHGFQSVRTPRATNNGLLVLLVGLGKADLTGPNGKYDRTCRQFHCISFCQWVTCRRQTWQ